MSAENIIKEIAPGIARRRVRRGYIWMLQKAGGFTTDLWLQYPKIYVPQEACHWQKEHILARVFGRRTFEWKVPSWIKAQKLEGKVLFDHVVSEYRLTQQFLIAHGFIADHIIIAPILDFVWTEAVFEKEYALEYAHLWAPKNKVGSQQQLH